jgi:hypothetical protein
MAQSYADSIMELKAARLAAEQRVKLLEETLRRTQERARLRSAGLSTCSNRWGAPIVTPRRDARPVRRLPKPDEA